MKVQDLFEAKEVDPELAQQRFERDKVMPQIKQLLGAERIRAIAEPGDEDLYKPKKEKNLKWIDPDGFESRYDLYLFNIDGRLVVKMEYNDYGGGTDPVYYAAKVAKAPAPAKRASEPKPPRNRPTRY